MTRDIECQATVLRHQRGYANMAAIAIQFSEPPKLKLDL